ncbi:hypothetical protein D3C81_1419410 [compost metagenome]
MRQAEVVEAAHHPFDEVVLAELPWADVHAQAEVVRVDQAVAQHAGTGIAGFVEDPAANFQYQPAFFQHLDELRRRLLAQLRVVPAQQHFGTDDAVVAGVDLGLEVQGEFAAGQGQAQVVFHAQTLAGGLLHGGVEHLRGVAP